MTLIRADNFYPWRNGGSIRNVYAWSITDMAFGACPSGYGTCVQRPVGGTTAGGGYMRFTIPTGQVTTEYGASAIYTIDIDPASTTWWSVIGFNRSGSNDWLRVQYQPSTNKWRVSRDLNIAIGVEFDGPDDVTQPFEIAMEAKRDAAAGYFRVWFDGVLAYEATNVNTGTVNAISLLLANLLFPGVSNTGGLVTASNWIVWNPAARPYPGRRIVQTLEPIADIQKGWNEPTTGPAYERLVLSPTGVAPTVKGGTVGMTNVYGLRDLTDIPSDIEAVFLHRHQVSGTVTTQLLRDADTLTVDTLAFGDYITLIPTPPGGGAWSAGALNAVQIKQTVDAITAQMNHMHMLVVRSVEADAPAPPTGRAGRAYIISSG